LSCTFLSWTISGIARQRALDEKGPGFRLPKRLWFGFTMKYDVADLVGICRFTRCSTWPEAQAARHTTTTCPKAPRAAMMRLDDEG
jgi:hypothetical protein